MTPDHYISILSIIVPVFIAGGGAIWIKKALLKKMDDMKPSEEMMEMITKSMTQMVDDLPEGSCKAFDIEFDDGAGRPIRVVAPLVMDHWVGIGMGAKIMGISSTATKTKYWLRVENSYGLKRHRHMEAEEVFVEEGYMTDRQTGRVFKKGDTWEISKEDWHAVQFTAPTDHEPCIVKVTLRPALQDIENNPIDLSNAAQLVGLAT